MAENINNLKLWLKNTPMYIHHVRGTILRKYFVIDLKIHNFFQMKDNVEYFMEDYDHQLDVYITKKRRSVNIGLSADSYGEIFGCFVNYDNGHLLPVYCEKKMDFLYEIELPFNVFNNSSNMLLKKGTLGILFQSKPVERFGKLFPLLGCKNYEIDDGMCSGSSPRNADEEEKEKLSNGLWDCIYYKNSNIYDFVIYGSDGLTFRTHKSILAARSPFFLEYINEYKEKHDIILYDVSPYALNIVLQYMYYGTLIAVDTSMMLQVLEVADRLQLQRLKSVCMLYLESVINLGNAEGIRKVGKKLRLEVLVEACDDVLSRKSSV